MSGPFRLTWVLGWLALWLFHGCVTASANDQASARRFLEAVYQPYVHGKAASPTGRRGDDIFAPALLELIREDQRLAKGEVGVLNHDPICSCQDYDGMADVVITFNSAADGHSHWRVSFLLGKRRPTTVELDLVQVRGGWRIADVREPGIPSLKGFLRQGLSSNGDGAKSNGTKAR